MTARSGLLLALAECPLPEDRPSDTAPEEVADPPRRVRR